MAPQLLHLPDGQTFTVTPVFAGLGFKSHELNMHPNAFPIGWNVVLHTEEELESPFDSHERRRSDAEQEEQEKQEKQEKQEEQEEQEEQEKQEEREKPEKQNGADEGSRPPSRVKRRVHPFTRPTLQSDTLFISSISNPSNTDFKPAASPTRQIAMMMWVTLYWYFHQPQPSPHLHTRAAKDTPDNAKPTGEWRINIRRDGVLRGRNLIPKLERMGLIASEDSACGTSLDDGGEEWAHMFVSRRMFWQIPGHLFLFTLQPNHRANSSVPGSPVASRPTSPVRGESSLNHYLSVHGFARLDSDLPGGPMPTSVPLTHTVPIGPFYSTSHLPTYFPPPPLQYTFTGGIRHPIRPKPHRMGEIFYSRFVPSVGRYLSLRVASTSARPVPYLGPVGPRPQEHAHLASMTDTQLLQMWMAKPRVSEFWGEYKPDFLDSALSPRHSFPVIASWDGIPFGYFEIYWVKEDILGRLLASGAGDFDRGIHVFVGEEWARGRVPAWLTSLVHWCFIADNRTMSVCLEPRIDNTRMLRHLDESGFGKERQISFPHKQSWYVRLWRDTWEGPAL
ncbi:acyl-CoA N-acyltransferase [Trichoderma ceciliae]